MALDLKVLSEILCAKLADKSATLEKVAMSEENSFGALLTYLRKRSKLILARQGFGWTQAAVAEALEVSERTYKSWELGERVPDQHYLKKIAELFKLSTEDEDRLYREASQAPPEIHNLPFPRNPLFTGRDAQLEQLEQYLKVNGRVALTQPVSISGLGGIGKTQLALEYAHRCYQKVYRAVFWVNAADEATLQGSYDDLAQRLDLPERDERDPHKRVQAVKQWLERHTKWLLIMDNADDLYLARAFLPVTPSGHVVVTTRSQNVSAFGPETIHIDIEAMEPREGVLFLLKRAGKTKSEAGIGSLPDDVRSAAEELAEMLGWHPLALDQAGAYIDEVKVSVARYIDLYREARRYLLARRRSLQSKYSDHPESVVATFEISFTMASEQHPIAMDILHFFTFLQPDAIPIELFAHDGMIFECDTLAFNEAIVALLRYSLVKYNDEDETFSMHRLVQDVVLDKIPADLQKHWRDRVVKALKAASPDAGTFKYLTRQRQRWHKYERLLPHVLVSAVWADDKLTLTEAVAEVFHTAGVYLYERGQYSDAETLLVRVPPLFKQHYGIKHFETVGALGSLAALYSKQGKYEQAELLSYLALKMCDRKTWWYGRGMPFEILHNLVNLYLEQGKTEQAQSLISRAFHADDKAPVPTGSYFAMMLHSPYASMMLRDMAVCLEQQGKYGQAEVLYQRALRILEEHPWVEYPTTVPLLQDLAALQHRQGKHDQAYASYRRAFYFQKQIGATHPDTQELKRQYVNFLRSIGRDAEADAVEADDEQAE